LRPTAPGDGGGLQEPAELRPRRAGRGAEIGPRRLRGRRHDLPERHRRHWGWNPSQGKVALEALFAGGVLSAAGRNDHFERIYALTRDVSAELPEIPLSYGTGARPRLGLDPDASLPRGVSGVENNVLDLTRIAARALGIARPEDLADYFRQL